MTYLLGYGIGPALGLTTSIATKATTKLVKLNKNLYINARLAYQLEKGLTQQGVETLLKKELKTGVTHEWIIPSAEYKNYFVKATDNEVLVGYIQADKNLHVLSHNKGTHALSNKLNSATEDDLIKLVGVNTAGNDFINGLLDANKYMQDGKFIPNVKKIDLMGGKTSQLGSDFANIDLQATKGINGDVSKLSQYIQPNSIDEIIVSNPFPTAPFAGPKEFFLTEASKVMKPGTTLTVNGIINNKFFKNVKVGNIEDLGFEIIEFQVPLKSQFQNMKFYQVDGITKIPNSSMLTTIIRKK